MTDNKYLEKKFNEIKAVTNDNDLLHIIDQIYEDGYNKGSDACQEDGMYPPNDFSDRD